MGKRKGCFNCCKRRIICDMTEPGCQKCAKRGLKCSGIGIRYRFNEGIASRGKFKGLLKPYLDACSSSGALVTVKGSSDSLPATDSPSSTTPISMMSSKTIRSPANPIKTQTLHPRAGRQCIQPTIQFLNGTTRFLFCHFSSYIAPVMVAIDTKFNGYRTVLLPLAFHNTDVRRAVCIVSALHLGNKMPLLCDEARHERLSMIAEFRREVEDRNWPKIISTSHWAVIILLLVGEMISGGEDFSYLVKMLLSLVDTIKLHKKSDVQSFLFQQTRMIQFFSCPFLGEYEGIEALSKGVPFYSEWISTVLEHCSGHVHQAMVSHILRAMQIAGDIYLQQAVQICLHEQFASNAMDIQLLKSLVEDVHCDTPGSPAFVWVYFIGAASSTTENDRAFFRRKLMAIHSQIGFQNIALGLESLDRVCKQSNDRWTELLPSVATLVM